MFAWVLVVAGVAIGIQDGEFSATVTGSCSELIQCASDLASEASSVSIFEEWVSDCLRVSSIAGLDCSIVGTGGLDYSPSDTFCPVEIDSSSGFRLGWESIPGWETSSIEISLDSFSSVECQSGSGQSGSGNMGLTCDDPTAVFSDRPSTTQVTSTEITVRMEDTVPSGEGIQWISKGECNIKAKETPGTIKIWATKKYGTAETVDRQWKTTAKIDGHCKTKPACMRLEREINERQIERDVGRCMWAAAGMGECKVEVQGSTKIGGQFGDFICLGERDESVRLRVSGLEDWSVKELKLNEFSVYGECDREMAGEWIVGESTDVCKGEIENSRRETVKVGVSDGAIDIHIAGGSTDGVVEIRTNNPTCKFQRRKKYDGVITSTREFVRTEREGKTKATVLGPCISIPECEYGRWADEGIIDFNAKVLACVSRATEINIRCTVNTVGEFPLLPVHGDSVCALGSDRIGVRLYASGLSGWNASSISFPVIDLNECISEGDGTTSAKSGVHLGEDGLCDREELPDGLASVRTLEGKVLLVTLTEGIRMNRAIDIYQTDNCKFDTRKIRPTVHATQQFKVQGPVEIINRQGAFQATVSGDCKDILACEQTLLPTDGDLLAFLAAATACKEAAESANKYCKIECSGQFPVKEEYGDQSCPMGDLNTGARIHLAKFDWKITSVELTVPQVECAGDGDVKTGAFIEEEFCGLTGFEDVVASTLSYVDTSVVVTMTEPVAGDLGVDIMPTEACGFDPETFTAVVFASEEMEFIPPVTEDREGLFSSIILGSCSELPECLLANLSGPLPLVEFDLRVDACIAASGESGFACSVVTVSEFALKEEYGDVFCPLTEGDRVGVRVGLSDLPSWSLSSLWVSTSSLSGVTCPSPVPLLAFSGPSPSPSPSLCDDQTPLPNPVASGTVELTVDEWLLSSNITGLLTSNSLEVLSQPSCVFSPSSSIVSKITASRTSSIPGPTIDRSIIIQSIEVAGKCANLRECTRSITTEPTTLAEFDSWTAKCLEVSSTAEYECRLLVRSEITVDSTLEGDTLCVIPGTPSDGIRVIFSGVEEWSVLSLSFPLEAMGVVSSECVSGTKSVVTAGFRVDGDECTSEMTGGWGTNGWLSVTDERFIVGMDGEYPSVFDIQWMGGDKCVVKPKGVNIGYVNTIRKYMLMAGTTTSTTSSTTRTRTVPSTSTTSTGKTTTEEGDGVTYNVMGQGIAMAIGIGIITMFLV